MPLDGSDVASKPVGTTFAPNTTIQSSKVNSVLDDIYSILNTARSIAKGFTGASTAIGAHDNLNTTSTNIASATTTDLSTATGVVVNITGTTTITGLGTVASGAQRVLIFAGALTLTHNATSLILPGGANITTAAGDVATFRSKGSGNWVCASYQRATGGPTLSALTAPVTITSTAAGALLVLESTDAGASSGPTIELYRNSATPAAADSPGRIEFYFKDSGGNKTLGGALASYLVDPTNGSEDVYLTFQTTIAGALGERGYVAAGMYLAGATGGDKGAGTLNATALYVNGQSVATDTMSGFIGAPANKTYTLVLKCPYGGTINETVTKSASGTCTATFKINGTPLGGTANSVSSSEQTQAQASANTFVAGDDIEVTISSNSSCLDMAFTIKVTKSF